MSWVEDPRGDPLGVDASESWRMSTVPQPGADLAFYLVNSEPLPRDVIPAVDPTQWSATENATSRQTVWVDDNTKAVSRMEKDVVVASTLDLPPTAVAV